MKPEGILRGGRPLSLYLQCGAGADEKERTVFVWNSYSESRPVKNVRYYEKDRNFERKPARRARRRSSRRSRAAPGDGQRGHVFFLNGMNIRDCLGCFGGGKDPASPCVQKDDMLRTAPPIARRALSYPLRPYAIGRYVHTSLGNPSDCSALIHKNRLCARRAL